MITWSWVRSNRIMSTGTSILLLFIGFTQGAMIGHHFAYDLSKLWLYLNTYFTEMHFDNNFVLYFLEASRVLVDFGSEPGKQTARGFHRFWCILLILLNLKQNVWYLTIIFSIFKMMWVGPLWLEIFDQNRLKSNICFVRFGGETDVRENREVRADHLY